MFIEAEVNTGCGSKVSIQLHSHASNGTYFPKLAAQCAHSMLAEPRQIGCGGPFELMFDVRDETVWARITVLDTPNNFNQKVLECVQNTAQTILSQAMDKPSNTNAPPKPPPPFNSPLVNRKS